MVPSPSPYPLRLSAALVLGFGMIMILGLMPPLRPVLAALGDIILWPFDGAETLDEPITRLVSAICGGLAVGWGLLIFSLSGSLFAAQPEVVRRLVLRSYVAWFLADGLASLVAGAPLNLIGNALFFTALWAPIRRPIAR